MLSNALTSLAAGAALSVLLFVPVVAWQYRRYGEIAEMRLGLVGALLVYCSALVAYTMFPLPDPSRLTPAWCAAHDALNLDPWDGVRRARAATEGLPLRRALMDSTVLELVLNVALFVPLGWFARRVGEWRVATTLAVGAAVSLLVEVSQYTGLYGLFACAYRKADAVDLVTNTTGTALGVLAAAALPRLFPGVQELEAQAHRAREVDRGRRWLSQLLDGVYYLAALAVVGFLLGLLFAAAGWASREHPDPVLRAWMASADVLALVFAALSWTGDGSSPGQRTTWLRPVAVGGAPRPASRARRVLRPFTVMVPVAVLVFGQPWWPGRLAGLVWLLVAVGSILHDTRGLSGHLSGLQYRDARAGAPRG